MQPPTSEYEWALGWFCSAAFGAWSHEHQRLPGLLLMGPVFSGAGGRSESQAGHPGGGAEAEERRCRQADPGGGCGDRQGEQGESHRRRGGAEGGPDHAGGAAEAEGL